MTTAELLNRNEPQQAEPPVDKGEHRESLFTPDQAEDLRTQWSRIQGRFVDEPRKAVEEADALVANAIQRLTEMFANERNRLEHDWSQGQDVSTEDLRQALRRYRSFFDRLLSV